MIVETWVLPLLVTFFSSCWAYKNTSFGYFDFSALIWLPSIIIDLIAWLIWAIYR